VSTSIALGTLVVLACASSQPNMSRTPPKPDPRIGLRAGWWDAAAAAWNLRLVSNSRPAESMMNSASPGDTRYMNSDMAFKGNYLFQGNFEGYQIWDISNPSRPVRVTAYVCPGSQNDLSVYGNLLFASDESPSGRIDCGTQGIPDSVSADRMQGVRIFDIS